MQICNENNSFRKNYGTNTMINLEKFTPKQFEEFLESFDEILCDQDGVLFSVYGAPIAGVKETIKKLKELGKNVRVVTNNSTLKFETWREKILDSFEYEVTSDEVFNPLGAIIDHLQRINFDKELYVLGTQAMRDAYKLAGFTVAEPITKVEEDEDDLFGVVEKLTKTIGAVIYDADMNLNYAGLIGAAHLLKNSDAIYITGAPDKIIGFPGAHHFLGPSIFQDDLATFSSKTPYELGKPSINFGRYIGDKLKIKNPSRVLFVGDSFLSDIAFASRCGFKSLLVFTGNATYDSMSKVTGEETPDYYLESFGHVHKLLAEK